MSDNTTGASGFKFHIQQQNMLLDNLTINWQRSNTSHTIYTDRGLDLSPVFVDLQIFYEPNIRHPAPAGEKHGAAKTHGEIAKEVFAENRKLIRIDPVSLLVLESPEFGSPHGKTVLHKKDGGNGTVWGYSSSIKFHAGKKSNENYSKNDWSYKITFTRKFMTRGIQTDPKMTAAMELASEFMEGFLDTEKDGFADNAMQLLRLAEALENSQGK